MDHYDHEGDGDRQKTVAMKELLSMLANSQAAFEEALREETRLRLH